MFGIIHLKNFSFWKLKAAVEATKDRKVFIKLNGNIDWSFDDNYGFGNDGVPRESQFYWWCLNFGGIMIYCDCPQLQSKFT